MLRRRHPVGQLLLLKQKPLASGISRIFQDAPLRLGQRLGAPWISHLKLFVRCLPVESAAVVVDEPMHGPLGRGPHLDLIWRVVPHDVAGIPLLPVVAHDDVAGAERLRAPLGTFGLRVQLAHCNASS